ncbi:MAG: flagellar motor switch protein FliG, partial [Burkholderiaceae bacterium]
MAETKDEKKDAKGKDAKGKEGGKADPAALAAEAQPLSEALIAELEELTSTQRAATLMLLLGEQQAAEIIRYLSPREVQALGGAMVAVADLSQEAVNVVLDEFVATLKKQTSLGLGTGDYVEKVLKRALGDDKAASVLSR